METTGAHLIRGATLAFRSLDDASAEPVMSTVEFNSPAAAEFTLSTMSEKELHRRLQWAKTSAGIA